MDFEKRARQIKALGDETRLRIFRLLPLDDRCEGVYNVSEIAAETDVPQPTISHHLRVLADAGLIRCRRMCRDVYYWIDRDETRALFQDLNEIAKYDIRDKPGKSGCGCAKSDAAKNK